MLTDLTKTDRMYKPCMTTTFAKRPKHRDSYDQMHKITMSSNYKDEIFSDYLIKDFAKSSANIQLIIHNIHNFSEILININFLTMYEIF